MRVRKYLRIGIDAADCLRPLEQDFLLECERVFIARNLLRLVLATAFQLHTGSRDRDDATLRSLGLSAVSVDRTLRSNVVLPKGRSAGQFHGG